MTDYDYDLVIWDTVGGAYDANSMRRASGGSEKEVVQLAEGLGKRGLKVCCFNQTRDPFGDGGAAASEWMNLSAAKNIRCKTLLIQRYSPLPEPEQVLADRMMVRATDVYGDYYKHVALTHLCVSEWQANGFRAVAFPTRVIPAMLDDDYYELASTPKVRGRFIYASAYMKGLPDSLTKWKDLRDRFPTEMRDCELHVTSPGYGKLKEAPCDFNPRDEHVFLLGDLPPRELAKYMATCEGLFYVNTFPETAGMVAALAYAVGCKPNVLCRNGLAGLPEYIDGWATENERVFENNVLKMMGEPPNAVTSDFRVSTILPQWLSALHLVEFAEIPGRKDGVVEVNSEPVARLEEPNFVTNEDIPERLRGQPTFWKKDNLKMGSTPKVCLVMLANNAETTIRRALESVKDFVDFAVFQFNDQESSKAMRDVVLEIFPHHETSIPVEFTYKPWFNFRENRNALLDSAREIFGETYVLTLDADDEFVGLNPVFKSKLLFDTYEVEIRDSGPGDRRYPRRMLWKNDGRFKYAAPAHEFLTEGSNQVTTGRLLGVHYRRLGGPPLTVEQTRAKYLRDVRLFLEELKVHPEDTRSSYYLAQSFEDAACGDRAIQEEALAAYEQRMTMGGYIQEKFVSAMKVGMIRKGLGRAEGEVVAAFNEAARILPERAAEAVYEIMLYYNNEGGSKEKAVAAHEAANLSSFVAPEGFIVDHAVYDWNYRFQLAIALCYVNRQPEAKTLFEDLLTTAPARLHETIRNNLLFCVPPAKFDAGLLAKFSAKYLKPSFAAEVGETVEELYHLSPNPRQVEVEREMKAAVAVPWFTPKNT